MKRLIALLLFALASASAQVRVWQGTMTLPTYEEGQPDPNPPFDQYENNRFNYPYTLRHNLTDRRADHAWRARLPGERISEMLSTARHWWASCTAAPTRSAASRCFYENPSIKKAAVAYRGAWAAFGIEFNFPVSHNWVTASPVDFAFAKE